MAVSITLLHEVANDHRVYKIHFFGALVITTVTSDPDVIADWIERTMAFLEDFENPVVGMGVQWCPYSGYSPASTLQLAVGKCCLIIQLDHCYEGVPDILRQFLWDGSYTFVGIWNHSDARRLEQCDLNLEFQDSPLDLREYVETDNGQSLYSESFETIVEECLGYYGVRLEKEISMSYWEASVLSLDQVRQATVDAYSSFLIGRNYCAWEFKY